MPKEPTQPPPPTIRVMLVGDHPWADNLGWIKPKDGGYETLRVLGTGPPMVKVTLDNGEQCYAEDGHLQRIETKRLTSPPPPKVRR
jgi:hypothetical protein